MDTKNQFTYFLLSVGIGVIGGVLYEIFALCRLLLRCDGDRRKPLGVLIDLLFCGTFALCGVWATYSLYFPSFRVYMWLGFAVGGIIYSKTLRRIVAFSEKVCYNKVAKLVKKAKKRRNSLKKEIKI